MKYVVTKSDGTPVDPSAVYFVLRLDRADEEAVLNRHLITAWAERRMGYNPEGAKAAFDAVHKASGLATARAILAVAANMGKASAKESQLEEGDK